MMSANLALEGAPVIQAFGSLRTVGISLPDAVRAPSIAMLNRMLAHTMAMRDLYKKAHWQVSGATFFKLHQLFDKHYNEQAELMDAVAEHVQKLGGVALALAHDVAEETQLSRAPRGREAVGPQLERLLAGHETILDEVRPIAREAADAGDDGTDDFLVSQLIRVNELQSLFVEENLDAPGADR